MEPGHSPLFWWAFSDINWAWTSAQKLGCPVVPSTVSAVQDIEGSAKPCAPLPQLEELPSNQSLFHAGRNTQPPTGGVWVPSEPTPGQLPAHTFRHDLSHPTWRSAADYDSMVNWRSTRVLSNDRLAASFNGVCHAARALNGLDHRSDPLPWLRDGVTPSRDLRASARYDLDVARQDRPHSSSGEDECMRDLLVDSEDDNVPPGPSVGKAVRLCSARRHAGPASSSSISTTTPSSTPANSVGSKNHLIRKISPVTARGDLVDVPLTRRRCDGSQKVNLDQSGRSKHGQSKGLLTMQTPVSTAHPLTDQVALIVPNVIPTIQHRPFGRLSPSSDPSGQGFSHLPHEQLVGPRGTNRMDLDPPNINQVGQTHDLQRPTAPVIPNQPNQHQGATSTGLSNNPTDSGPASRPGFSVLPGIITPDHPSTMSSNLTPPQPPNTSTSTTPSDNKTATPSRMRWPSPGKIDVIWLTQLIKFRPFAVQKEQNDRFHKCTVYIKASYIM
ncbi:uncharacterized protein MELLADRAFT_65611 [Melampsora larici-populina 98AG31]|uniref:Secreted protein n=1 Tax=Melampsora larici-populina (strain 98AG31 / pathotype 3-4-7) TaxID=747676 RepID=F4RW25_MELLP|nr:uncharacterized protein MELLADRAFT_65611 [Melampsora larici-populina 98AG31]EGG03484.1 hypothetical protein MELLADRAFT_65611 [Melampsora larici-populina 98AG31]